MAFIPATPGIVGFGGGNKPAVFQAIAPQYQLINQQTDDDQPLFCHDALGDNLSAAVSGILNCGGCYTFSGLPGQSFQFSFTGVNGVHSIVWNGTSAWVATIGRETLTIYSDEVCGTVDSSADVDIILSVTCDGDNQFSAQINWGSAISGILFSTLASATLAGTIFNALSLSDCGTGNPPSQIPSGYDGQITITT